MIHPRTLHALEFDRIKTLLAGYCQSESGRKQALNCAPLPNEDAIYEEQKLYDEATTWASRPVAGDLATVSSLPGDFPDITGFLEAVGNHGIAQGNYDTEDFWALRSVLIRAKSICDSICQADGETKWPRLAAMVTNPPLPTQLTAALIRCLSDDGAIRDESSPELLQVRVGIRHLHQTCLRKVRTFAEEHNILSYLQDEFMTLASDRYVLPFKANYKGRMQGIIHDWSQTGETCYFEPLFLVELNNRIQELKREEREEEHKVLAFLAGLLETEFTGAQAALTLLTKLDVLAAKRRLASVYDGRCVPLSNAREGICLLTARHPLLYLSELDTLSKNPNIRREEERRARAQQKIRPLDIILRPGERALIVTGGNAGGKTVCLKTLGLLVAMTLCGLPVPVAPGSHLPWFSRVDAFIGDEQSLDDNVSTFTAQIDHLSKAWKHLDDSGLVLLDEFGSGTDPAQGAALAQAVLDELINKHTFVLTATHFPALKGYALTREHARAASMLFDPASHKPLYELAYDQVGASQALDVARSHGLPEAIIQRAEHYLLQDGQDATALLHKLNDLAAERAEELRRLKSEQAKAKSAASSYKERLEADRLKLYEEVRSKAQELMQAWKEDRVTHRQALKEMSALRAGLAREGIAEDANGTSSQPLPSVLHIGDTVMHTIFRKKGQITEIDNRRKKIRLDLGGVGLWADMKDIREYAFTSMKAGVQGPGAGTSGMGSQTKTAMERQQKEKQIPTSDAAAQSAIHAAAASFSVDVRGLRADAAIAEVQACIDRAYLAEFAEVEIVHGRGTGVLRRTIHAWLGTCSAVASYEIAPADRGGDGMTIVRLK